MNMVVGKRQLIIVALVFALGVTIFFFWKLLGVYEINSMNEGKSSITNNQENSTNDSVENYFATARLTRDQAKDQADEVLNTQVINTLDTAAERQSAESEINTIDSNVSIENNIESLVEAYGFDDCIATINDGIVNVIVQPKGSNMLSANYAAQVEDIVIQQTKVSTDNIRIIQYDS